MYTRSEDHASNIKFDRKLNALLRVSSAEYKLWEQERAGIGKRIMFARDNDRKHQRESDRVFILYNKSTDAHHNTCYIYSFSNAKIMWENDKISLEKRNSLWQWLRERTFSRLEYPIIIWVQRRSSLHLISIDILSHCTLVLSTNRLLFNIKVLKRLKPPLPLPRLSHGDLLNLHTLLRATGCPRLPEDSGARETDVGCWSLGRGRRFRQFLILVLAVMMANADIADLVHPGDSSVYAGRWSASTLDARTLAIRWRL